MTDTTFKTFWDFDDIININEIIVIKILVWQCNLMILFFSQWCSQCLLSYFYSTYSCTFNTFLVHWTDYFHNKFMISHTDIKNSKIDMTNTENDLINKAVFEHLNCNRVGLYSNMAQMTIFCFQKLFIETDRMWTAADLMKNIDEIH